MKHYLNYFNTAFFFFSPCYRSLLWVPLLLFVAVYAACLLLTDADFTFSLKRRAKRAHAHVLISSSHTTRQKLLNQASPLILLHQSSPFPILLLTHTSIKGHKREQGHYHTVMVLTHLNSLAKDGKDGVTADTMGLRNLYSTFSSQTLKVCHTS